MSKIAIIGSGVSGLVCAYRLGHFHDVHLFESNDYAGGHTATKRIELSGQSYLIDTGFIVFNDRTYPRFQALLKELDVDYQETEMSFSVNNPELGLVYNGNSINSLFCQRKNLLSPTFYRFVGEILRFNKDCKKRFEHDDFGRDLSLGDYLQQNNFSSYFRQNYILPMGAAIWSSSLQAIEAFPLKFFVQFFYNHGLLDIKDRPQWYTIKGGSNAYVKKLLDRSSATLHLNSPVFKVRRTDTGVTLINHNGEEHFDEIIMACHSDQALELLQDPSDEEAKILGDIPYRHNDVVLHTDASLLPPTQLARASWNYHCDSSNDQPAAVTYSMNILQRLPPGSPVFNVTLNKTDSIDKDKILGQYNYSHPVFSQSMVDAQKKRDVIDGVNKLHYCGAYWYNGFHEDGVHSAQDVCERILGR